MKETIPECWLSEPYNPVPEVIRVSDMIKNRLNALLKELVSFV